MLILPKPKRELTVEEHEAIHLLRKSGVSVLINFSLKMTEGTEITPKGDAYGIYENDVSLSPQNFSLNIQEYRDHRFGKYRQ